MTWSCRLRKEAKTLWQGTNEIRLLGWKVGEERRLLNVVGSSAIGRIYTCTTLGIVSFMTATCMRTLGRCSSETRKHVHEERMSG